MAVPHNALVYRDLPQVPENGAYGASRAFSGCDGTLAELRMDKYAAPVCVIPNRSLDFHSYFVLLSARLHPALSKM